MLPLTGKATMPTAALPSLGTTVAGASADHGERVLQFGTGAFLRGLPDAVVDEANRAGRFDGRVVMVGSTGSGRAQALGDQDGLYTLCVRGLRDGEPVDETHVVTAVSRALASASEWEAVLDLARDPALCLVISNTTEVGITDDPDDRRDLDPPRSFPAKLAAVLAARAEALDYRPDAGLVVLPCELIEGNGDRLRQIVETHAERWGLGDQFGAWLRASVTFCNTLVDRIVPGTPDDPSDLYERLGYTDDLLTVAEPYRLWAIEGNASLAERLPISGLDGVVVTNDLTPYRERKVRILNGGHTATVPAALLCGLATVSEAMQDDLVGAFVRRVILDEIVPSLDVDPEMAEAFAHDVLDRFANPFIAHDLLGITFQQTTKLGVRVVPSILEYAATRGEAPPLLAFGVAAFLASTRPGALPASRPADDAADAWRSRWASVDRGDEASLRGFARDAVSTVWGADLGAVDGLNALVADALVAIERDGCRAALRARLVTPRA